MTAPHPPGKPGGTTLRHQLHHLSFSFLQNNFFFFFKNKTKLPKPKKDPKKGGGGGGRQRSSDLPHPGAISGRIGRVSNVNEPPHINNVPHLAVWLRGALATEPSAHGQRGRPGGCAASAAVPGGAAGPQPAAPLGKGGRGEGSAPRGERGAGSALKEPPRNRRVCASSQFMAAEHMAGAAAGGGRRGGQRAARGR